MTCLFSAELQKRIKVEFMDELRHYTFHSCTLRSADEVNKIVGGPSLSSPILYLKRINSYLFPLQNYNAGARNYRHLFFYYLTLPYFYSLTYRVSEQRSFMAKKEDL